MLFSVRSRYLFAIGLEECLVFAVDARDIHEGFPTPATLELTHTVVVCVTGLSPCIALRSRRLHADVPVLKVSPNTTLPVGRMPRRLRFGLSRVHSPLLTGSRSVSLPAGTEMFQFPAFPIAQGNCRGIPIRRSLVLSLRAAPQGLSQLGTSFFSSRAEPSTSWYSSHVYRSRLTR